MSPRLFGHFVSIPDAKPPPRECLIHSSYFSVDLDDAKTCKSSTRFVGAEMHVVLAVEVYASMEAAAPSTDILEDFTGEFFDDLHDWFGAAFKNTSRDC